MIQSLHLGTEKRADRKSRRLIIIAWLFVTITVFTLAFTYYSIALLSAGRAYVGGEGLWSKAQKDMVYSIARYARYHDESYYRSYLDSLAICHGDRLARLELEKENPNLQVAFAGFLQGGNHPDDINGMIRLFRNFRHTGEIGRAIDIWTRADDDIDELTSVAERIRAAVQTGVLDDTTDLPYLQKIYQINQHLRPMEDEFSYTLGAAARKTQALLLIIMFAVVSVLLVGAFMFSQRLLRQSESIQRALRDGENQLRSLLQFAPLPIVIVHMTEETILYANDRALQQFKVAADSLSHLQVSNFYVRSADRDQLLAAMHGEGSLRNWEVQLRDANGTPFWALFSSQRIFYNGQDCVLTALSNIDEHKRTEQKLHHRAFHDELTGLPNRAMFMDSLSNLLARCTPGKDIFAILFIDLDRFKIINDELGHEVGDKLLQEVAARLKASVQHEDIVARLGGDEFVVLIEASADSVARTAQDILKAMKLDYILDENVINVTTSIGISFFPKDGISLAELIKSADIAMYYAKDQGRNNIQYFHDAVRTRVQ